MHPGGNDRDGRSHPLPGLPGFTADLPAHDAESETVVVPVPAEQRAYISTLHERADRVRRLRMRKVGFVARSLGALAAKAVNAARAMVRLARTGRCRVTVLHKIGPQCFRPYLPGDPLTRVFDLMVKATGASAAAEIVFAVTNSSHDELHCDRRYADQVAAYRAAFLRSTSVGDVLLIRRRGRTTAWACEPSGFRRLRRRPTFSDNR